MIDVLRETDGFNPLSIVFEKFNLLIATLGHKIYELTVRLLSRKNRRGVFRAECFWHEGGRPNRSQVEIVKSEVGHLGVLFTTREKQDWLKAGSLKLPINFKRDHLIPERKM